MTDLFRISFSTISYVTEDLNLVIKSLKQCFPEDLRSVKIQSNKIQSQFGDKLVLLSCDFKNQQVKQVTSYLSLIIDDRDKKYLSDNLEQRVDLEERIVHFRLDKFTPLVDKIKLATGSDVIKVELKYQVFTSQQNNLDNIRNCLLEEGLILS